VPKAAARLAQAHPGLELSLIDRHPVEALETLRQGEVFTAIKVAGAAYLIVLGARVVRDRRRRPSGLCKEGEPGCQARW
jgi:hypothetical protein